MGNANIRNYLDRRMMSWTKRNHHMFVMWTTSKHDMNTRKRIPSYFVSVIKLYKVQDGVEVVNNNTDSTELGSFFLKQPMLPVDIHVEDMDQSSLGVWCWLENCTHYIPYDGCASTYLFEGLLALWKLCICVFQTVIWLKILANNVHYWSPYCECRIILVMTTMLISGTE